MSDIRRTYFTMPGTFEPANPTKWAFVVTSIKVAYVPPPDCIDTTLYPCCCGTN